MSPKVLISACWDSSFDVDTKAAFLLCKVNECEKQEECNSDKIMSNNVTQNETVVNAFF